MGCPFCRYGASTWHVLYVLAQSFSCIVPRDLCVLHMQSVQIMRYNTHSVFS